MNDEQLKNLISEAESYILYINNVSILEEDSYILDGIDKINYYASKTIELAREIQKIREENQSEIASLNKKFR